MNFVYVLRCADGTLYTGWTNNLEKRFADHQSGKGAKYTRGRSPLQLIYHETYETRNEAMKREHAIKKMSRRGKLKMIECFQVKKDISK